MPRASAPAVSLRALGRASLDRQLLLERSTLPILEAVHHLVGLQAQVPTVPYTALWNRLADFDPEQLSRLTAERDVVRIPTMRSTIHLLTRQDAVDLRALMQPVLSRAFGGTAWAKNLMGHDVDAIVAAGRELLDVRPRTRVELGRALAEQWPDRDPAALAVATTYLSRVVQTTPRGLWGAKGQATWTTLSGWLGLEGEAAVQVDEGGGICLDEMVLRYLSAFGPATVKDIQTWCYLTKLREVVDRLGPRVRRLRGEDGAELVDVADGTVPDPDTPAPPRFLPEYDNALLSYADRRRVIAPVEHVPMQAGPGGAVGTLLVDGLVSATWAVRRAAGTAALEVRASTALAHADREAATDEGGRLLRLLAPDDDHDVRWSGVSAR